MFSEHPWHDCTLTASGRQRNTFPGIDFNLYASNPDEFP